jgi:hypothetical protein
MALTKYDLVNTKGLKGLNFDGEFIPLDQITDQLAEQLEGKTHILKKKTPAAAGRAAAALGEGEKAK